MAKLKNKIIVLSGVTGSGKTALSIDIAKMFNCEIISADSRQVYKYLDIGTAKITKEEMQGIPHYLIDNVDPVKNKRYSVADFLRDAYPIIDDIIGRNKIPLIVGGTGLYSRSIISGYGFDEQPNSPKYDVLQICLMPDKELMIPAVRKRNEARIDNGMIEETKKLLEMGVDKEFLYLLGLEYRLNIRYIDGEITLPEYKELLFNQTMQFIKRQKTWYRKENPEITHYLTEPENYKNQTIKLINLFLT